MFTWEPILSVNVYMLCVYKDFVDILGMFNCYAVELTINCAFHVYMATSSFLGRRYKMFHDGNCASWVLSSSKVWFPPTLLCSEQKCIRNQKYAAEKGLPILKNVLLPRTKGFCACLEELRGSLDAGCLICPNLCWLHPLFTCYNSPYLSKSHVILLALHLGDLSCLHS